ncbi:hypothetical protein FSP39_011556 [Pinctada imbricata]|uniref:Uncharacterized protein n=1 Tax=Pinctada imbricata TaxID=66713 RepID=A0AA88YD07_PINIB|nr:hypothetical protein FSP39_011556 [Pinctada imbricata]
MSSLFLLVIGSYCKKIWDGALCWEHTKAGTMATQPCPGYLAHVTTSYKATKLCTENGTWWVNPITDHHWTNFTACINSATLPSPPSVPSMIIKHFESVRLMYNIGYGMSLVSLIFAACIMLYFKKLHCPRNTIHLNLFLSFILRAAISFVKENLLVEYVGFPIDVYYDVNKRLHFRSDILHWECKLFFTLLNYIIAANYTWILVEALYLQMLISVSVFTEKSRVKLYILFGWAFPLLSIIPWVIVRSILYNEYCWNISYENKYIIHIIYGPITVSIVVQVLIFINIVRILFTKLNASPCPETKKFRYRRLAKSTLILIPLFGVYYIIFAVKDFNLIDENSSLFVGLWWAEFFFNSFQGFLLSLLFCYFNTEVQTEFKKAWYRHTLQRGGSTKTMKSTFYSRSQRYHSAQNGDVSGVEENEFTGNNSCIHDELAPRTSTTYTTSLCSESVKEQFAEIDSEINETIPCLNNNRNEMELKSNMSETKIDDVT